MSGGGAHGNGRKYGEDQPESYGPVPVDVFINRSLKRADWPRFWRPETPVDEEN